MMKIDYNKLVELLLPTFLRRPRIIAMLRVLVAKPLQGLFVTFHLWRVRSRYEASVTPQVCSLKHAIERTFDCVVDITELDGKPYDFLVEVDRSTDLNAIKEFLDKHKLAGKSYVFRLGDTHYQAGWKNYVQENIITLFKANWTGFIREDDGEASLFLWFWKDPDIAAGGFVYKMRAFSSVDVKETVSISGITFRKDGFPFPTYWREFLISIFPGTNEAEITIEIEEGEDFERDIYIGDYTATDGTYSYQLTVFRFEPPIIEKPPIIWA